LAQREPRGGVVRFRFVLDGVQLFDPRDGFVRFPWTRLFRVDELPPGMRPAADFNDRPLGASKEFVVPGIRIALQITAEVFQEGEGPSRLRSSVAS
jgi:hypothetical protein